MKYNFTTYPTFDKEFKRLAKRYKSLKQDFLALVQEIEQNANAGTNLGHGIYKYRLSIVSKGKGKRGGARVISINVIASGRDEADVGFLYIYDKSDRTNITDNEIKILMKRNGL